MKNRFIKMETIISPPTQTKKKCYEQFEQETLAWAGITNLEKGKQAIGVALNFPDDDEHKITEKVFDEIELDDLKNENGLSIRFEFLDKQLAKKKRKKKKAFRFIKSANITGEERLLILTGLNYEAEREEQFFRLGEDLRKCRH